MSDTVLEAQARVSAVTVFTFTGDQRKLIRQVTKAILDSRSYQAL